ncbi:MAG: hypothetical protein IKU68_08475 [Oscillospiraceae bacterium]|nr:hypothetical protein [Oscillospiraceae bacterium]
MKRKTMLCCLAMLAALLLNGCAMRTIDELYTPPRRSKEYSSLQTSINIAMAGMEYSAPLTGDNQQAVQMADLTGDGVDEYLVFAKDASEKPMQIMVFQESEDDEVQISEIIVSNGFAFDMVEYVEIDGKPGMELVVGKQVSDQLMRSVSVYSFASGRSEQLLNAGYSKLLTCDLGSSDQKELLLIQRGESDQANAIALLYRYRSKSMVRSVEVELSQPASNVKRLTDGTLQCGTPAVYVSSTTEDDSIRTDILALKKDRFSKVSVSEDPHAEVRLLRNYYVYAEDVDSDGILELPSLVSVRPVSNVWMQEQQYQICWYSVDLEGNRTEKLNTFHNYSNGWYLELDSGLANRITMYQVGNTYAFYIWNENYTEAKELFTILSLSGSDRETQAHSDGRFILYRAEGVIYAAKMNPDLSSYGITKENLINSFHLIHQDWNTGET